MKLLTSNADFYHPRRVRFGHGFMYLGAFGLLVLSLLSGLVNPPRAYALAVSSIAQLSNDARSQNGLPPLRLSIQLTAAAQAKAQHMVKNGYFDHTSPDGVTGWSFIEDQNYAYTLAGENLAASNEDDASVVNGWMNSPGHRANLLGVRYSEVGYGIAYKGDYNDFHDVSFVVALYAEPRTATQVAGAQTSQTSAGGLIAIDIPKIGTLKGSAIYGLGIGCAASVIIGGFLEIRHLQRTKKHLRATGR